MNLRSKFRTQDDVIVFVLTMMSKDEAEFQAETGELFWTKNVENAVDKKVIEVEDVDVGYKITVVKPEAMFRSDGHICFRIKARGKADWQSAA